MMLIGVYNGGSGIVVPPSKALACGFPMPMEASAKCTAATSCAASARPFLSPSFLHAARGDDIGPGAKVRPTAAPNKHLPVPNPSTNGLELLNLPLFGDPPCSFGTDGLGAPAASVRHPVAGGNDSVK